MGIRSKIKMKPGKLSPFAREVMRELSKRVAIGFPAGGPSRQPEPGDLTGWLWTGLIERISQDHRSWTCGEVRRRVRSRSC